MIWCYTFLSVVKSFIEESLGKYLKTVLGKAKNRYFEKKNLYCAFQLLYNRTVQHSFSQLSPDSKREGWALPEFFVRQKIMNQSIKNTANTIYKIYFSIL